MLMIAATLGDISVTLNRSVSLTDVSDSFILSFHDLPTNERQDLVFLGENDAVMAFAAWLRADEAVNPEYYLLEPLKAPFKP